MLMFISIGAYCVLFSFLVRIIVGSNMPAPPVPYACAAQYTVEPPNNGHIGGGSLVHCREVVLISEVR